MARIRYNGLTAELGAPLTSGDTTITFAAVLTHSGGTAVPTITGTDYIPLAILNATGGLSEIVNLTAYTSGATTGTITRAQESTVAVAHTSGDQVVNGPTARDIDNHGTRLYTSASQLMPASGWTPISFDAETWDTDGYHSTATNPTRITIPAGFGGKYLIAGTVSFAANSTGSRFAGVRVNGTTFAAQVAAPAIATYRTRVSVLNMLNLAAGDYIELLGYQTTSGTLDVGDTTANGAAGETQVGISYLG